MGADIYTLKTLNQDQDVGNRGIIRARICCDGCIYHSALFGAAPGPHVNKPDVGSVYPVLRIVYAMFVKSTLVVLVIPR